MPENVDLDELDLSDAELMEVLKSHGMSRRVLMKVFGVSAGVAALGGTAAGSTGRGTRIDKIYGATYAAGVDTVPAGLVDHLVELHIRGGEGDHAGFPIDPDSGDEIPAEFFFDPVGLHVTPGEIVDFNVHNHLHTVTSFHPKYEGFPERVPTDHALTSPPISDGDSWLYKFTTKGVYDLLCLPHLGLGMVMRVVVFDPAEDSLDDSTFEEWGPLPIPNAGNVLSDDALDPANIVAAGEVAWSDLTLP